MPSGSLPSRSATCEDRGRDVALYEGHAFLKEVRACTLCEPNLPLGARPVLQMHPAARVLVVSQAPGSKAHASSGIPFDDQSGERLREWLRIDARSFYDRSKLAIVPMGFCYPGRGKTGDLPPRPECAPAWRAPLLDFLDRIELTLVIGQYAQRHHFDGPVMSVTNRVSDWRRRWPSVVPMPHPSPLNYRWLQRNPWFEEDVLPALRERIAEVLR